MATTKSRKGERRKFAPPANDNLSTAFDKHDLVPDEYRGTDKFIDLVTWNVRWFHDQDPNRVENVVNVLAGLNADIIVLQEIRQGSLDVVARALHDDGTGSYVVSYGTTGADQRVAVMYDLDWIRAKDDIHELFGKGAVLTADGRDAFPRLPLWAYLTGVQYEEDHSFDFQLVGLHMKSQVGGGGEQRTRAAGKLAEWLTTQALGVDADVVMVGDWNKEPDSEDWQPIHQLEDRGVVKFQSINNPSEISHLMYKNVKNLGSRLDLNTISMAASERMQQPPKVVRWVALEKFLEGNPKAAEIKAFIKTVGHDLSDHLPVVTRFYFTDPDKT